MAKKITKTIPMIAAVNEVAWYVQEKDTLSALSVKARWNLKKNMKELDNIASQFHEFKTNLEEELRAKYTTDEMSNETVLEDGNIGRKVKDEYLEDYQKDIEEMNAKVNELLYEDEEVNLYVIDMDDEVERMTDDADLSDAAMDMLSLFEDIEGETE